MRVTTDKIKVIIPSLGPNHILADKSIFIYLVQILQLSQC